MAWLVIGFGYALLGALGLMLAIPPGYSSPVFPAAGLALAVALHYGVRVLPAIWLGSFALNVAVALISGNPSLLTLMLAAGIATGASIQAWGGQLFVRRWLESRWQDLDQEKDVLQFLMLGGGLACTMSATFGVTSLMLAGVVPAEAFAYTWWTWYVGDTLGVLIAAPLLLGFLQRNKAGWHARLKTIAPPVFVTLLIAIAMFWGTARWENERQYAEIAKHGEAVADAIERRIISHREALASLARLIEVSPDLHPEQFDHFTKTTLLEHPDISALSFNPYLTLAQRSEFEGRMARMHKSAGFRITERDASRQLVRAGERAEYVPVGYISPLEGNQAAVGFDINSEPLRKDAISRARLSGHVAVTAPVRLVQDNKERAGVLVLAPAFKETTESFKKVLIGFAVAVIKIDEMVAIATQERLAPGLMVELLDPATDEFRRVLYRSADQNIASTSEFAWQTRFKMADRDWVLRITPGESYLQEHRPWGAWSIGVVGLLFAALLQVLMLGVTARSALIKRRVAEQTTEIRNKSAALIKSEMDLREAQRISKIGSWELDHGTHRLTWSDEICSICQFSPATFGTAHAALSEAIHCDDRDAVKAAYENLLKNREPYSIRYRLCMPDGQIKYVLEQCQTEFDDAGNPIRSIGTIQDVTEQVMNELALQDAKQAAEQANVAKSQFLATMSHEIRTPMNGILGMAQMLMMDNISEEERRDFARTILNSGQTLLTLLNDILDFSKIEAGKLELENTVIDPAHLLHEIANLFNENATGKGLTLACHWEGPAQNYLADPHRLRQMLSNLTNNAIKFTRQGKVTLSAREIERSEGKACIEFSVADTGIGIDKDKLPLLFTPFSQADASITRQFGGTGLGLSIVRSIATKMGGSVGVESAPGEGARFWFRIQADVLDSYRGEKQSEAGNPEAIDVSEKSSGRILVVEDNPTNQKVIASLLNKLGFSCQIVGDGAAGVQAVETDPSIALILMDVQMPIMDGYEATGAIRTMEMLGQQRHRPIIAMTANAFEEDRQLCLNAGMDDFLTKPIDLEKLKVTLQYWLRA